MKTVIFNGQPVWPSKVVCVGKIMPPTLRKWCQCQPRDMVVFMKPATSIGRQRLTRHWVNHCITRARFVC